MGTCPLLQDTEVPREGQDKLEENQFKSKETTALEWSTSAPPAGGGDREPLRLKRDRSAGAEDRSSKPKGRERGEWTPAGAGRKTQWEKATQLDLLPKKKRDRKPPNNSKSGQTRRVLSMSHHLGQSIPPPDGAYWNRRPPTHTAVDRTNRAQQWQRKEDQSCEQELTPQHYQLLLLHLKLKGTAEPTLQMQEQSCPPSPQPLPGKKIPPRVKTDLARTRTAGGKAATARLTKRGDRGADDPETTGAWETATVSTPSCCSRLVCRLLSTDRKRSEDRSDRSRDRKRSRER